MKRILLGLISGICLSLAIGSAAAQPLFQNWLRSGSGSVTVRSFRSSDSTYVVLGNQRVGTGTSYDHGVVTKLDRFGNILWNISFPDSPAFTATSITEYVGMRYAIAGKVQRSLGSTDAAVITVDQNGNMLWARDLGPCGPSAPGVALTYEAGVIVSYESEVNPNDYGTRPMMASLGGDGNLLWARKAHDTLLNVSRPFGVIAANIDEGVAGVGGGDMFVPTFPSPFVYWTMPSQGTRGYDRIFLHDSIAVEPRSMYLSRTGFWIVAGQAHTRSGRLLPFIAGLSSDQIVWFRLIDLENGSADAIAESGDRVLTIGLNTQGDSRTRFLVLSPDLRPLFARSLKFGDAACTVSDISSWGNDPAFISGTVGYDSAGKSGVEQFAIAVTDSLTGCNLTSDSIGLIEIANSEFQTMAGRIDTPTIVIKPLDSLRCVRTSPILGSLCNNDVPVHSAREEHQDNILISPNPATPGSSIYFTGNVSGVSEIALFDITGKRCWSGKLESRGSSASMQLPTDIRPGTYEFTLHNSSGGTRGCGKLVVEP